MKQLSIEECYELKEVKVRLCLKEGDKLMSDTPINTPDSAMVLLGKLLRELDRECLVVVNVDSQLKPINYNLVSIGSLTETMAPMGNIFKSSILTNAYGLILAHNHPGGNTTPSKKDIEMTKRAIAAGKLFNLPVLDHVIMGDDPYNYYSIRERRPELFNESLTIDDFNDKYMCAEPIQQKRSSQRR